MKLTISMTVLALSLCACASISTRFSRLPVLQQRALKACVQEHSPCGQEPQWMGENIEAVERYNRWSRRHSECMDGLLEEYLALKGQPARSRWLADQCPRFRGVLAFP